MQQMVIIKLCGVVDKTAVEQLFTEIVAALAATDRLVIDGREIEAIDLGAVRTLCGVHRYVVSRGSELVVEGLRTELLAAAISETNGYAPWSFCQIRKTCQCLWAPNRTDNQA